MLEPDYHGLCDTITYAQVVGVEEGPTTEE